MNTNSGQLPPSTPFSATRRPLGDIGHTQPTVHTFAPIFSVNLQASSLPPTPQTRPSMGVISFDSPSPSLHSKKRRSPPFKENSRPTLAPQPATELQELIQPPSKRSRTGPGRADKLQAIFAAITAVHWTLGEALFNIFDWHQSRTKSHAAFVEHFLAGKTTVSPAKIVDLWMTSPDGRVPDFSDHGEDMWSLDKSWLEIKPVRQCLTSFAAQSVEGKVIREVNCAVAKDAGLHLSLPKDSDVGTVSDWLDVGVSTVTDTMEIIKVNQRLLFGILMSVSTGKTRKDGAAVAVRTRRPADKVVTHAISSLDFCRNNRAKRLPLSRGILYFASSAPTELFQYESRTGTMPSYSNIYNHLRALSRQESLHVKSIGSDSTKIGMLHLDNTQSYLKQRDMRIGRENKMSVGIGCTYVEAPNNVDVNAFDLDRKLAQKNLNKRALLTVPQILDWIDQEHIEFTCSLQWLQTLVTHVPALAVYKPEIDKLYNTVASKGLVLPRQKSGVHPLGSNAKNEAIITELKEGLLDMLHQTGKTREQHLRRLIPAGGDGLTYQEYLKLKKYLQFHDNEFESFELLQPMLEWWHEMWTDLCRIFQRFWGEDLSRDPSSLGHSAHKISRDKPADLKKVDYYPGTQLLYMVLDARILHCWSTFFNQSADKLTDYFDELRQNGKLPTFDNLLEAARRLYQSYGTTRAVYQALYNAGNDHSEWAKTVPRGTPWTGVVVDPSEREDKPAPKKRTKAKSTAAEGDGTKKSKKKEKEPPKPVNESADYVLANWCAFLRDATLSREALLASTAGHPKRFYEVVKVWLLTFSGSTHGKYATYVLETLVDLELESDPELRDALLSLMLISLNGHSFVPGDLMQEWFNRILEFLVEKKGKDFDSPFIREVISRNLHHFSRVKKEMPLGLGLEAKTGVHAEPHTRPEMKILGKLYAEHEMGTRRPGRVVELVIRDDLSKGIENLEKKKLPKFLSETTRSGKGSQPINFNNEGDEDDTEELLPGCMHTLGTAGLVDGELVIETLGVEELTDSVLKGVDEDEGEPDELIDESDDDAVLN